MPSERTNTTSKSRSTKFKPPWQTTSSKATKASRSEAAEASGSTNTRAEPVRTQASSIDATPTIPPQLLTKLLYENFTDEQTRISKDANVVVAKYMETFVREALARAAYERKEGSATAAVGGTSDPWLEVRVHHPSRSTVSSTCATESNDLKRLTVGIRSLG